VVTLAFLSLLSSLLLLLLLASHVGVFRAATIELRRLEQQVVVGIRSMTLSVAQHSTAGPLSR